jgi:hypothetical protein
MQRHLAEVLHGARFLRRLFSHSSLTRSGGASWIIGAGTCGARWVRIFSCLPDSETAKVRFDWTNGKDCQPGERLPDLVLRKRTFETSR